MARVAAAAAAELAVSIISADEQIQGRLTVIRQARTQTDAARGYTRLRETLGFYQSMTVIDYGEEAATRFDALRKQGVRIGTQNLRIAVSALVVGAIVVTRNTRDFIQVPGLVVEDWTVVMAP